MFVNGAAGGCYHLQVDVQRFATHRSHQAYFYDSTKHLYIMSSSVFKRAYTASSRTYSSIIPYRMSNRINGVNRHFVQYRYRARLRPSFRRSTQRLFTTAAEEENAQAVETALQRVMRLQSEKQFRTYGGGFLILGMSVWIYGSTIIDYFSGNVAEVTSKSIASVEVQSGSTVVSNRCSEYRPSRQASAWANCFVSTRFGQATRDSSCVGYFTSKRFTESRDAKGGAEPFKKCCKLYFK